MEGISLGIVEGSPIASKNIFAILNFKHDDMTGYWPYSSEFIQSRYTVGCGIPTLEEELLLSPKCLIKW